MATVFSQNDVGHHSEMRSCTHCEFVAQIFAWRLGTAGVGGCPFCDPGFPIPFQGQRGSPHHILMSGLSSAGTSYFAKSSNWGSIAVMASVRNRSVCPSGLVPARNLAAMQAPLPLRPQQSPACLVTPRQGCGYPIRPVLRSACQSAPCAPDGWFNPTGCRALG